MTAKAIIISTAIFLKILCPLATSSGKKETIKIEKVAEPVNFGEEPHWDVKSQKLYYVSTLNGAKIIRYDPATKKRTYASVGTMAIRVNFYAAPNRESLFKIDKDGTAVKVISPISLSNGMTWSLKNDVMYYIDTPTHQIWAFYYDVVEGTMTNKRVVFDVKKNNLSGKPDGMTIDFDENSWIALFRGKAVININPKDGKLLQKIEMPVEKVTSVAFGGPNLKDLYVTTSRTKVTPGEKQSPDSGSLYRIIGLGVKGVAPYNCKYNP